MKWTPLVVPKMDVFLTVNLLVPPTSFTVQWQRWPDSNARCHSLRSGVGIFTRVERSEGGEIEGKGPTDRSRFDRPVKDWGMGSQKKIRKTPENGRFRFHGNPWVLGASINLKNGWFLCRHFIFCSDGYYSTTVRVYFTSLKLCNSAHMFWWRGVFNLWMESRHEVFLRI